MQVSNNGTGTIAGAPAAFEAVSRFTPSNARAAEKSLATSPGQDTTTFSAAATSAASLLSQALAGDASQPGKVKQIAAAVSDGSYRVDADRLTSTLIESMLQSSPD